MTVVSMKEMDVAFILTWSMLNVEFPQEESNLQTAVCFSHDSFIYLFFFFDKIINIITIITNLLFNLSVKDCMRKQLMRFLFFFPHSENYYDNDNCDNCKQMFVLLNVLYLFS